MNLQHVSMIHAAAGKRLLVEPKATGDLRLRTLEAMNRLLDFWFTAEMLALVDPASDIELEMLAAAKSLDPPEQTPGDMPPSYAILSDKFERFAALNAGIRKALEWRAAQDVLRDATTAQSLAEARAEYARPKPTSGKDPARLRSATAASMARAESAEVRGAISEIHRPP